MGFCRFVKLKGVSWPSFRESGSNNLVVLMEKRSVHVILNLVLNLVPTRVGTKFKLVGKLVLLYCGLDRIR